MSRFNNPSKTLSSGALADSRVRLPGKPLAPQPLPPSRPSSGMVPVDTSAAHRTTPRNVLVSIGFFLYCTYMLSGFANDWAMRLFGNKAYISTVSLILLPLVWLLSGNAFRGLRKPIGLWWTAFLFWMLLSTPFSVWKGGSVAHLFDYVPKSYVMFFYIASFTTSIRRCRYLMYAQIAGSAILLFTCLKFGTESDTARFQIPDSLFYANANDLALGLLMGITFFLFLFWRPGMGWRVLAIVAILASTAYMLKTGSRGSLLAGIAMLGMILVLSRNKLQIILLALPVFGLALVTAPSSTLHRLTLLVTSSGTTQIESEADASTVGSQLQREELFKKSLYYSVRHPLFGVGPNQFAVAVDGEASKIGQHVPWLGTHNSYTQVSSECGIPACICYCAVIFLCFRMNYRLYKQTRDNPALREVAGLSSCMLAGTLVYAVSTLFFHVAYGGALPALAGFSLALQFAAEPLVESPELL